MYMSANLRALIWGFEQRVDIEQDDFKIHGLFKRGLGDSRSTKPLIVLIHGTGTNRKYFDNVFHS